MDEHDYGHHVDFRVTSSFDDYYGGYCPPAEIRSALKPLTEHLKKYDGLRRRLQKEGGTQNDLARLTNLLKSPIQLGELSHGTAAALVDPTSLRRMVAQAGDYSVHLDVRKLDSGLPVYYLCRTVSDYVAEYSSAVEDLYVSPDYPMGDPRFVRLMYCGHETYFIRTAQFRSQVRDLLDMDDRAADAFLVDVTGTVFQAAWHEDQLAGVLVAQHLALPCFQQALELLYLCLSGELCEIRSVVNPQVLDFLQVVYPQPAIRGLLERLATMDGADLTQLPEAALKLYAQLSRAFSRFLDVEVTWGYQRTKAPLYKLVFGNFRRLADLSGLLQANARVRKAGDRLETEARTIIDEITR